MDRGEHAERVATPTRGQSEVAVTKRRSHGTHARINPSHTLVKSSEYHVKPEQTAGLLVTCSARLGVVCHRHASAGATDGATAASPPDHMRPFAVAFLLYADIAASVSALALEWWLGANVDYV